MTAVTRSVRIFVHATLQSAFDYASDLTRHPEWNDGLRIEELSAGPIVEGKEYASWGEVAVQKDRPNKIRVSRFDPPHKFAFISHDPDFGDVSHEFTFEPQNEGVSITRTMTVQLNPVVALIFSVFIYPFVGRPSMKKSFARLKTKLETI